MIFKNGTVLTEDFIFKKADIRTCGQHFAEIAEIIDSNDETIDCTDKIIVPGLVDIHTHGCLGYDSSMRISHETIDTMSRFYASHGVTTYLPTIESNLKEDTLFAIKNLTTAKEIGVSGANIGGIHMEGPYFNLKNKGAQNEACIRLPDIDEFKMLYTESNGNIKLISLAPELSGAMDFIKEASKLSSVSIGHTDADYDEAKAAIICGASVMTHTFNAMRPLHHRNPNAIGAALESDIFCEFICDGFHVSPVLISLMYKLLSDERMLLISDSIRAAGMPDGQYELAGLPVFVRDGKAHLENGAIAGSTVTLYDCVINAIKFGIPAESAFKMGSLTPSRATKIDSICGSIAGGKRADMLILNKDYSIDSVFVRGKRFE